MRFAARLPLLPFAAGALALVAGAVSAHAHFKMLEPAGWIVESERGDPQKARRAVPIRR